MLWCSTMKKRIIEFPEVDERIWNLCRRNHVTYFYELIERLDDLCNVAGAGAKTRSVLCSVVEKYNMPKPGTILTK